MRGGGGGRGEVGAIETVPALETARPALKNLGPCFLQSLLLRRPFHRCPLPHPSKLSCPSISGPTDYLPTWALCFYYPLFLFTKQNREEFIFSGSCSQAGLTSQTVIGWVRVGGISRSTEGLFESPFLTHAAAPNLHHHSA